MPDDRTLYKKLKQREYRANQPPKPPRVSIATATQGLTISLGKAGLVAGATYTATPQGAGAILLTPIKEQDQ